MPDDLTQYLPALLAMAGGALQFLMRQFKGVPEWAYYLTASLLALGAYYLVNDFAATRGAVVQVILWLSGAIPAVLGGTFVASSAAKSAVSNNPNAQASFGVPLTDSK